MALYSFKSALAGLWREKWINLLTVFTMATGLFLMAAAFVVVHNVQLATRKLPDKFSLTVFLEDGLSDGEAHVVADSVKGLAPVKYVNYISKAEALRELRGAMKDADYILEGLDENPLPASLEVGLRKDSVNDASVSALSSQLERMKGVSEVRYGKELLSTIQAVKRDSQGFAIALVAALSAGLIFVCYSAVKILFYRKKDEIETLKLLGATKSFIKGPFLIEGGVIGLAGGALSAAAMLALYYLVYYRLASSMPLLKAISVPVEVFQYQPAAGFIIGVTGAFIAVGRIKF